MATKYTPKQQRTLDRIDQLDELITQEIESGEVNKLIRKEMKQLVFGLRMDIKNDYSYMNMTCEERTRYRISRSEPITSAIDMD